MKKVILFLFATLLIGCTCIGQIPTQMVYINQDCEALLPDYVPMVEVSDNCTATFITQDPLPGTILIGGNMSVEVIITAIDESGNESEISFDVVALDTISPLITPTGSLVAYNLEDASHVLDANRLAMGSQLQYALDVSGDSTWIKLYNTYTMVTFSAPPMEADSAYNHLVTWYPYTQDPIIYVRNHY